MDARFDEIAEGILPAEYASYPRTQLATSTYSLDTDHNEKLYCSIYRVYHSDGHKYILNQRYSDGVENSIHIAETADSISELGDIIQQILMKFTSPEVWGSIFTDLFNQFRENSFIYKPTNTANWRELYSIEPKVYTKLFAKEIAGKTYNSIYPCGDNVITVSPSETVSLFGDESGLNTVACTMGSRAIANDYTVVSLGIEPFYTDSYQKLRYDINPTDNLKSVLSGSNSLHLISETKDISKKQLSSFLKAVVEFEIPILLLFYLPGDGLMKYIDNSVYTDIKDSDSVGLIWYKEVDRPSDAEVDWVIELPEVTPESVSVTSDSVVIDPFLGTCATDSELNYYRGHPIETEMYEYLSVAIHNTVTQDLTPDILNYVP